MNKTYGNEQLEAAIHRSLEQTPDVSVPADFAARVRASLPLAPVPRRVAHTGRSVAMVASVVAAAAMFALAPHTAPAFTNLSFDMELLLLAELAGIGYWFVGRHEA